MIVKCANCGKEFETKEFGDGLCSDLCREATWIKRNTQQNRQKLPFLDPKKSSKKPSKSEK